MKAPWLAIVGIGTDGLDGLSAAARTLVSQAEWLVGGERHLAMIPHSGARRMTWGKPFNESAARVAALKGQRVCVLASGDPMWFGAGASLTRLISPAEMTIMPHPGAFSLAAARLGWSLQETLCLSAHGRSLDALALHLWPGLRLFLLAEDGATPAQLAKWLVDRSFGSSTMTVLENLGGPGERRRSAAAAAWTADDVDPVNTIALDLAAEPGAAPLARVPGLPDDAYHHDGQLTKREVRAVTLAALAPGPDSLLWDIGAGAGSIAIEWARAGGRAVALEKNKARCAMIAHNAARLGVPQLVVVEGEAPAGIASLDGPPDAVFIGGGLTVPGVVEAAWNALPPGGRLVANAVSVAGEMVLLAWQQAHGGTLTRLSVARLADLGGMQGWRPLKPVTQYAGRKP